MKHPDTAVAGILAQAALLATALLSGCFSDRAAVTGPRGFPTDVTGLEFAKTPIVQELKSGDTLTLDAGPVKKTFRGMEVRMLGYNGSIPGPIIKVKQGSEVVVRVRNRTGLPTSLHSHGVRMDYQYDGSVTQAAIPDGGSFVYRLRFPDPGLFWYHAHAREDYSQELGLYGNIRVEPADSTYWKPVDREQILMLDDFYLDTAVRAAPFKMDEVDRTMMGRFGNIYLVNGDTTFSMTVKRNELVRFLATNSANTRVFNVGIADSDKAVRKIKVVGTDIGQYEYFDTVASTTLAPGERKIFEAHFDKPGTYLLTHHILKTIYNVDTTLVLGRITVQDDSVSTGFGKTFLTDDVSAHTRKSIDSVRSYASLSVPPDKELLFTGFMGKVAVKKISAAQGEPISIEAKGIEWLDHMAAMNELSNRENMKWYIKDTQTDLANHEIKWKFPRGAKVKIRIRNDTAATHPMPHPIHFHGQRFLIVAVNGIRNLNMAWKDTYLVGTRETTDILLDASNPGTWMAHCHISEHAEAMMMFHYTVE